MRFRIDRDMISGQSKGCAVAIQVRYTRFVWFPQWAQQRDSALFDVKLFAPSHDPDKGYRCTKFKMRFAR